MGDPTPKGSDSAEPREAPKIATKASEIPHGPFVEDPQDTPPVANPLSVMTGAPGTPVSLQTNPFPVESPTKEAPASAQLSQPVVPPPPLEQEKKEMSVTSMPTPVFSPSPLLDTPVKSVSDQGNSSLPPALIFESNSRKGWWLALLFVVFAGVLGGLYYYFYVYAAREGAEVTSGSTSTGVDTETTTQSTDPIGSSAEFSLTSPNYLPLNVETVSVADIQLQLRNTAERIRLSRIQQPVEFFVTDQNNVPLAFSRFVVLANVKLPTSLVSATEESFSLFLFNDQGKNRVGWRVGLKDKNAGQEVLRKNQESLPGLFQNLFLESVAAPLKKEAFQKSIYQGSVIYYSNVLGKEQLSFDYTVLENDWYVGTSKATLRAILDRQIKK